MSSHQSMISVTTAVQIFLACLSFLFTIFKTISLFEAPRWRCQFWLLECFLCWCWCWLSWHICHVLLSIHVQLWIKHVICWCPHHRWSQHILWFISQSSSDNSALNRQNMTESWWSHHSLAQHNHTLKHFIRICCSYHRSVFMLWSTEMIIKTCFYCSLFSLSLLHDSQKLSARRKLSLSRWRTLRHTGSEVYKLMTRFWLEFDLFCDLCFTSGSLMLKEHFLMNKGHCRMSRRRSGCSGHSKSVWIIVWEEEEIIKL